MKYGYFSNFVLAGIITASIALGFVLGRDTKVVIPPDPTAYVKRISELEQELRDAEDQSSVWRDSFYAEQKSTDDAEDEVRRLKAQRRWIEPFMKSGALVISEK